MQPPIVGLDFAAPIIIKTSSDASAIKRVSGVVVPSFDYPGGKGTSHDSERIIEEGVSDALLILLLLVLVLVHHIPVSLESNLIKIFDCLM